MGERKSYTHVVKYCKMPRHTVERQLDALRCIGIFPGPEDRDLTLHIPHEAETQVEQLGLKNFIVIHPVSRWRFKCWPTVHMAELIHRLHARGYKIVLIGSPEAQEKAMNEEIVKLVKKEVPLMNLSGKISLKELGALIKQAQCLICVDSVPLHMASSLKTPVVALFGPSSDQNWGPWMHPKGRGHF